MTKAFAKNPFLKQFLQLQMLKGGGSIPSVIKMLHRGQGKENRQATDVKRIWLCRGDND